MTVLAQGQVTDRPWGMTLGALGMRGLTGQVAISSEGKQYVVAFSEGIVIGAFSPLVSDAAVRLALTQNLITSTQVGDITRRMAAEGKGDRNEVDLLIDILRLPPDQAGRLRRRMVAQRAARTFSPNRGEFVVEDEIHIALPAAVELDVRTVIYLGAKTNLAEDRLISELASLGAYFEIKPESLEDVPQFGLSAAERVVVDMLMEGAYVDEIIAAHPALGDRIVRAIVYSLASCGALKLGAPPRAPRGLTPTQAPTHQQRGNESRPIVPRATTPTASPRTMAPSTSAAPRTMTPSTPPATTPRTMTPSAPAVGRTPTPMRNAPPGQPAMPRTSTGNAVPAATPMPGSGAIPRTTTAQPGSGAIPRTTTAQPGAGAIPRTTTAQPGSGAIPGTTTAQPGSGAIPRTTTQQGASTQPGSGMIPEQPGSGAIPVPQDSGAFSLRGDSGAFPLPGDSGAFPLGQDSGSIPVTRPRTPSTPPPGTENMARPKRASMQPPMSTAPATPFTPASSPSSPVVPTDSPAAGKRSSGGAAAPRRARRDSTAVNEIEQLLASKIPMLDQGVDHFTLLGLASDAATEHVRSAYFTLARKLHPDRLSAIGVDDEQRRAQRLMAQVNLAFAVLNDPAKRQEYESILGRGGEAVVKAQEAKADEMAMRIMRAEEAFKQGEMALRRDQLKLALDSFEMALELQPKEAEYQALVAWTKFAMAPDKNAVAGATRKALMLAAEANDRSPTAKFYLGRVERMLGREKEALQHFQDVLAIKPSHTEAASEARILSQRLNKR